MSPAVDDIEQLDSCKLLGVILQSNLKMDSHALFVVSTGMCTALVLIVNFK